ncbi:hypothetical protein L9F63_023434, partial [Diploptera punctata]
LTLGVFTIAAVGGMFFTNIVTTEMTLPIIISILRSLEEAGVLRYEEEENPDNIDRPFPSRTASCYLIGATYCASIGGTATVTGCGTNLATRNFINMYFPLALQYYMSYQMWFAACFVVAVVEVFIVWIWLNVSMLGLFWENRSDPEIKEINPYEFEAHAREIVTQLHDEMGPMKASEILVASVYPILILLWLFRNPIHFDGIMWVLATIFSPSALLNSIDYITDVCFGIIMVLFLGSLPSTMEFATFCKSENKNRPKKRSPPILEFKPFTKKVNWFTFVTMGGGFALIRAMQDSDFLLLINMNFIKDLSPGIIMLFFCFATVLLTQIINNTALLFIIMPIAARVATLAGVTEFHIIVCVGVSCSLCFLLPIASVPNRIMYSKAKIPLKDLVS